MGEQGLGWSQDTVMRLVDEFKKKPELWDTSHEFYRVQTKKYEAWLELASMFDCDIADLRRKMNSILASLRREKVKVRCGGRSSWFLYDHLNYLPRHLPNNLVGNEDYKRKSKKEEEEEEESEQSDNGMDTTATHDEEDEEENEVEEEEEQQLIYIKHEPIQTRFIKTTKYPLHTPMNKPRLVRRIRKKPVPSISSNRLDSKILETLKLIRRSDFTKKKDECDSFGDYIANSLRKHDERTQCMIKQAINNILFEQEMKKYGSGPYEVLIATDENPLILEDSSK